ncbi:MAG: hypothetical protein HY530_03880 [Chloroflexi bacterium]|nr:hypothetical protein [Chloroflexota bacterium]
MARMTKMTRAEARRLLADVPEQYAFWCSDGAILSNMIELRNALNGMTEQTFAYHSNASKSDFSQWVKDIIKDTTLANELAQSTGRVEAARRVAERVAYLSKMS